VYHQLSRSGSVWDDGKMEAFRPEAVDPLLAVEWCDEHVGEDRHLEVREHLTRPPPTRQTRPRADTTFINPAMLHITGASMDSEVDRQAASHDPKI